MLPIRFSLFWRREFRNSIAEMMSTERRLAPELWEALFAVLWRIYRSENPRTATSSVPRAGYDKAAWERYRNRHPVITTQRVRRRKGRAMAFATLIANRVLTSCRSFDHIDRSLVQPQGLRYEKR